jgi:hypothetical protein
MEAAASAENRKRPRFPAAAWKTLRVSHSSHGPRPRPSPTAGGLDAAHAISDTLRPSPGVAAFQPFPPGRVSTSGESPELRQLHPLVGRPRARTRCPMLAQRWYDAPTAIEPNAANSESWPARMKCHRPNPASGRYTNIPVTRPGE